MIPLENSDEEFPWKQTVVLFSSVLLKFSIHSHPDHSQNIDIDLSDLLLSLQPGTMKNKPETALLETSVLVGGFSGCFSTVEKISSKYVLFPTFYVTDSSLFF